MAVDGICVVVCFLVVVLVCVVVIDIVSEFLDVVLLVAVDIDELAVDGVISGKVVVDIFLAVSKLRLGEL